MNPTFLAAVRAHGGPGTDIRTAAGTIRACAPAGRAVSSVHHREPVQLRFSRIETRASAGGLGGTDRGRHWGRDWHPVRFQARDSERRDARNGCASSATKPAPAATTAGAGHTRSTGATAAKAILPAAEGKKTAAAKPQASPPQKTASAEPEARSASTTNLLSGAAPTVPAGSFDSRFGFSR